MLNETVKIISSELLAVSSRSCRAIHTLNIFVCLGGLRIEDKDFGALLDNMDLSVLSLKRPFRLFLCGSVWHSCGATQRYGTS